jgi:hypothetical protein
MPKHAEVSIPFSGQRWGQLRMHGGLRDLSLGACRGQGSAAPSFMEAEFDGVVPRVHVEGSQVELGYSRWSSWLDDQTGRLDLHPCLPWHVAISGGMRGVHAEWGELALSGVSIRGGVCDVLIELPEASGSVPIRIHGGVDRLTLVRPYTTALRLRSSGGAASVQLDDTFLSSVGGALSWQAEGEPGGGYYDVELHGGACRLVIARCAPLSESSHLRPAWT